MSSPTPSTIRANIYFAEKDRALRDDVHRLGKLVGELVREQGGEALFDLVETARKLAIAHREGNQAAYGELKSLLASLAPSTARAESSAAPTAGPARAASTTPKASCTGP